MAIIRGSVTIRSMSILVTQGVVEVEGKDRIYMNGCVRFKTTMGYTEMAERKCDIGGLISGGDWGIFLLS